MARALATFLGIVALVLIVLVALYILSDGFRTWVHQELPWIVESVEESDSPPPALADDDPVVIYDFGPAIDDLMRNLNDTNNAVEGLEERTDAIENRFNALDEADRQHGEEIRNLGNEIEELRRGVTENRDFIYIPLN